MTCYSTMKHSQDGIDSQMQSAVCQCQIHGSHASHRQTQADVARPRSQSQSLLTRLTSAAAAATSCLMLATFIATSTGAASSSSAIAEQFDLHHYHPLTSSITEVSAIDCSYPPPLYSNTFDIAATVGPYNVQFDTGLSADPYGSDTRRNFPYFKPTAAGQLCFVDLGATNRPPQFGGVVPTGGFTLALWVRIDVFAANNQFLHFDGGIDGLDSIVIGQGADATQRFCVRRHD